MNVLYTRCVIREQIDRAESLKAEIPGSQRHAALGRLAAECRGVLEEQSRLLEQAACLLDGDSGGGSGAAEALRVLKHCTRTISEVEGYAMPPLHCQSEKAVFLNDVLSAMHREVGLPFPCPAAPCMSSEYYFVHPPTNTVHVPLSEAAFLLHMPDFYHELGHLLLDGSDHGVECGPILDGVDGAVGAINDWYSQLTGRMERESAPAPIRNGVKWMWSRWRLVWIQEAFCDLFALFAAGPAYAHSNLHLVSKVDQDIHELKILGKQDHSSGEARMRLLDIGMRLLGHEHEAARVRREWGDMAHFCGNPRPGYDDAFPSGLLRQIAAAILPTFGRAGLRGYSCEGRASGGSGGDTVAGLLNEAWRGFWRDKDCGFRDVEKAMISRLAAVARRSAAAGIERRQSGRAAVWDRASAAAALP